MNTELGVHADNLRDRIAAMLRLHQWRATVRTSDDDPVLDCACGIAFGGASDCQRDVFDCYREHVADAVIRELGWREEVQWDATYHPYKETRQTRYVTEWVPDTPQ